jgi:hypothetical protein
MNLVYLVTNESFHGTENLKLVYLTEDRDPMKGSCETGTLKFCLFPVPIRNYQLIWSDSDL